MHSTAIRAGHRSKKIRLIPADPSDNWISNRSRSRKQWMAPSAGTIGQLGPIGRMGPITWLAPNALHFSDWVDCKELAKYDDRLLATVLLLVSWDKLANSNRSIYMRLLFAVCLSLCGLVLLGSSSKADILLAGWDFDPLTGGAGNFGPTPFAATSIDSGITSSGLIRNHTLGTGSGAANAWGANNFNTVTPSFDSAVAAGNFFSFTINPNSGNTVSFTQISAYNVRRSSSGPTTGRWQFAVGAGSFQDIGADITWGGTTTAAGNAQSAVDLSGIGALQSAVAPITFRVVTWGATTAGGTWYLNDPTGTAGIDFGVRGNVAAVPEPASMLLLGVAGVGGLAFRRFRRKRVSETIAS